MPDRPRISYRVELADRSREPGVWVGQERHRSRINAEARALFWAQQRGESLVVQEGGRADGKVHTHYYTPPAGGL